MKRNKLLSLLLALTLIITCFPAMVFADDADSDGAVDSSTEAEATALDEEIELVPEGVPASRAKLASDMQTDGKVRYLLDTTNGTATVYSWDFYNNSSLSGTLRIPDYINADDGRRYPVTAIDYDAFIGSGLSSITVPACVTSIGPHALGYNESNGSYYKISGFTIFGTNGSAAQSYARGNGITFRDPVAEEAARKEAARQGIRSSKIAKMKISSIKPAKKSFTVKWKKLSKKQIKKGKVNMYEVWVCKNKGFGPYDTSVHLFSKKYSKLKLRGATRKTTYYVKLRAVRYVNGVKYVGKWSKIKKVRTK